MLLYHDNIIIMSVREVHETNFYEMTLATRTVILMNFMFTKDLTFPQTPSARDGAGVTPGLRRRRERAERHKSFLKEQQEAAANGIFAALEQREGLGKLWNKIPNQNKLLLT